MTPPNDLVRLRLREAMALAIDRDAHAHYAMHDTAIAATGGLVSPQISGHLPDIAPPPDPERAAHLVREALGGSAPPALTITAFYNFGELGERLASEWRAIGIDAQVHTSETFPELGMTPADASAASVAVAGWIADYPDPDTVLRVGVTSLLPRWRHPPVPRADRRGTRTTDPAERLAKYQQAERVLAREYIIVPLVYLPDRFMIKPWVLRYPTVPFFYNGFWQDVVIDHTLQR